MFENRKPSGFPQWIERHAERPDEFHCSHPELTGRYVMNKPNFGRDLQIEKVKGAILGVPNPTPEADTLAEWVAVWEVGLATKPDVNLNDIVDSKGLLAIYQEVVAFWRCFRSPQ